MPTTDGYQLYVHDPIVWLLVIALAALAYYLSTGRRERLRRRRAALRAKARRTTSPRERRELMLQWRELGGGQDQTRSLRQRDARAQGQKARAAGQTRWANPYLQSLWGRGRRWHNGWASVDRNIRWIERQRG